MTGLIGSTGKAESTIPVVYVFFFVEHVKDFLVEFIHFRVEWGKYHGTGQFCVLSVSSKGEPMIGYASG
jgi:hypothetical protein